MCKDYLRLQDERLVIDELNEVWNGTDRISEGISLSRLIWLPDLEMLDLRKVTTQKITTPNGGFFIFKDKRIDLSQK